MTYKLAPVTHELIMAGIKMQKITGSENILSIDRIIRTSFRALRELSDEQLKKILEETK